MEWGVHRMPPSLEGDRALAKGQQQFKELVERTRIQSAFLVISEQDDTAKENVPQWMGGVAGIWWTLLRGGELRDESRSAQMKWMKAGGSWVRSLLSSSFSSSLLRDFRPSAISQRGQESWPLGMRNSQASLTCGLMYRSHMPYKPSPEMGMGRWDSDVLKRKSGADACLPQGKSP